MVPCANPPTESSTSGMTMSVGGPEASDEIRFQDRRRPPANRLKAVAPEDTSTLETSGTMRWLKFSHINTHRNLPISAETGAGVWLVTSLPRDSFLCVLVTRLGSVAAPCLRQSRSEKICQRRKGKQKRKYQRQKQLPPVTIVRERERVHTH